MECHGVAFTTVTSIRSVPIPCSSSALAAPTADQRPAKPAPRTMIRCTLLPLAYTCARLVVILPNLRPDHCTRRLSASSPLAGSRCASAGIVEPSLQRSEIERSRRKRPDNLEAYDL